MIVQDKRIVSSGYNGAPPGMDHCTAEGVGCDPGVDAGTTYTYEKITALLKEHGCQRTVHAEANAIAWAARHGAPLEGATMYSTHSPCRKCAELMASAGIVKMVWQQQYRATPWDLIEALGIEMVQCG